MQPLPQNVEQLKRYERKKVLGAQFLAGLSVQQIAAISPQLKSSMDNFINQLEAHVRSPSFHSLPFVHSWYRCTRTYTG